jgi:hypothetical protein
MLWTYLGTRLAWDGVTGIHTIRLGHRREKGLFQCMLWTYLGIRLAWDGVTGILIRFGFHPSPRRSTVLEKLSWAMTVKPAYNGEPWALASNCPLPFFPPPNSFISWCASCLPPRPPLRHGFREGATSAWPGRKKFMAFSLFRIPFSSSLLPSTPFPLFVVSLGVLPFSSLLSDCPSQDPGLF